jgi:hypothetical protein
VIVIAHSVECHLETQPAPSLQVEPSIPVEISSVSIPMY